MISTNLMQFDKLLNTFNPSATIEQKLESINSTKRSKNDGNSPNSNQ